MQIGRMAPEMRPTDMLQTGQVGYMVTGLKSTRLARVGDTWHHPGDKIEAFPGFKPAKAMMYAGKASTSQHCFNIL